MLFNDYKNVKTIVFSELSKSEKMKYFQFLLENDINFTRDESGSYTALVKILNPNFYGETATGNTLQNNVNTKNRFEDVKTTQEEPKQRNSPQKIRNKLKVTEVKAPKSEKKLLANYSQMFNSNYKVFFKALSPLVGVRGKKINLYQLRYYVEEIYSIRFIKDTSTLKSQMGKNSEGINDSFPMFVVEFLINKYVKKPYVDQNALDLLLSVDYFKREYKDIEIFAKFLNEEYNSDDLIFFLFVRSSIEKELKFMFIEKSKEEIKLQSIEDKESIDTEIYVNVKTCVKSKIF
jgi:hypothetical protein